MAVQQGTTPAPCKCHERAFTLATLLSVGKGNVDFCICTMKSGSFDIFSDIQHLCKTGTNRQMCHNC